MTLTMNGTTKEPSSWNISVKMYREQLLSLDQKMSRLPKKDTEHYLAIKKIQENLTKGPINLQKDEDIKTIKTIVPDIVEKKPRKPYVRKAKKTLESESF